MKKLLLLALIAVPLAACGALPVPHNDQKTFRTVFERCYAAGPKDMQAIDTCKQYAWRSSIYCTNCVHEGDPATVRRTAGVTP